MTRYALIALGSIIVGMGIWVWLLKVDLRVAIADRDTARADTKLAVSANGAQDVTIKALQAELRKRDQAAADREKDVARAVAEAQAARNLAATRQRQLDALAAKDATNADCQSFLKQDLAKVCPNIAQSITERAK